MRIPVGGSLRADQLGQDAPDPRIAAVIVNHDTREHLLRCLTSLGTSPARVVVVDTGSRDGSAQAVRQRFPGVELIETHNRGYGGGANLGIRACATPYVLLLNSDTIVRPDAPGRLAGHLDAHPRAACAGPRLSNPDGSLQRSVERFPTPARRFLHTRILPLDHRTTRPVEWLKGAALALRRSAFDEVGGFDERYFMYFEEADLCRRLHEAGWETHFVAEAEVVHVGGASTSQKGRSMTVEFDRARERFYRGHYAPPRAASFVFVERLRRRVIERSRALLRRLRGGAS